MSAIQAAVTNRLVSSRQNLLHLFGVHALPEFKDRLRLFNSNFLATAVVLLNNIP
jgi:hypothetical protein